MRLESGLSSPLSGDTSTLPINRFLPSHLAGLKLWTKFNSGITVTGSGVSQWDDVSGNGNHLKQGTDANRMTLEADGSILGNGVNQFLKTDAFTLVQPETIYFLGKQVTWTALDAFFDGNAVNTGKLRQDNSSSPSLESYAGVVLPLFGSLPLDTYRVITTIFNGASSLIQANNIAPLTGNAGAANMGGFTLGASGTPDRYSNIQVKEILIYSEAHDAATRAKVISYLSNIGGL